MKKSSIVIHHAAENNLRSVSLEIPKNQLIVVTGVSGSGKSSLIFDVMYREAEHRYFGSLSHHAQQFLGKMKRPDVEKIEGLSPAIAVGQKQVHSNPRSTVGTITEIYDYLRLLYARVGKLSPETHSLNSPTQTHTLIDRNLFSFNSPAGACPDCKGLGVEDRLDPDLMIADENKSLRERALVITAPNGYIIYSQVTLDVLDHVCRAEGFNIDIPWKELTPDQKHIILYGSNKIEVPYGKHTLESRMRWTGITAKPREIGYYKGILPVMETILKQKRNKNILRFVRTSPCHVCGGARLNEKALSVTINGLNISQLSALQLDELQRVINKFDFPEKEKSIAVPINNKISHLIDLLKKLGLGYLTTDRESGTLSAGEGQRLKLVNLAGTGLMGLLYFFDEPSIGLHSRDTQKLLDVLENIRDNGNTVIVAEHEEEFIRHADWLVDIGPGAGVDGGRVLLNLAAGKINDLSEKEIRENRTLAFLNGSEKIGIPPKRRPGTGWLVVRGAMANNLKKIDVKFKLEALNVVTGVSGAGKSTLTNHILGKFLRKQLHHANETPVKYQSITGWESLSNVITIDQAPIGRTPRSNPATYTGLSDHIRDLFAKQPLAKEKGFDRSRFSFNVRGGRCDHCEGAGYIEIGMHFMGNVEILCEQCEGKRFNEETLDVRYHGKNIYEILEMSIGEAILFFEGHARIHHYLKTLADLGLGYLKLGQRSSTLSGGEAQRIKLATELAKLSSTHTLYILDEPTSGLHQSDVNNLLKAIHAIIENHHTVVLVEHHLGIISASDHVIDLGPESGNEGGYLVATGTPEEIINCKESYTGQALKKYLTAGYRLQATGFRIQGSDIRNPASGISFSNVTTNNLQNIDVVIPHNQITVITGVSGSGKSSFAFDTLFAEAQNRFMESFSTYARMQIGMKEKPDFGEVSGLTPALAVSQGTISANARSTVGTITGIYDLYRLLYSRVAKHRPGESPVLSSLFSFNHQHGACPQCDGLGRITVCDPDKLITHPERSILGGAMDGTKTGKFYGDPHGQYIATLKAVAVRHGINLSIPWSGLDRIDKELVFSGTGNEEYEVVWEYKRDEHQGEHRFTGRWPGFSGLVKDEYERKHADHRGQGMLSVMKQEICPSCTGTRLKAEALSYKISEKNIAELSSLSIPDSLDFMKDLETGMEFSSRQIAVPLMAEIRQRLEVISGLGLEYLSMDRISSTLSSGEAHRIKLAGQIQTGLTGLTYVLDEPTVGLHPSDIAKLIRVIRLLQQSDNTVVIVEHDRDVILSADHVIDLGPGAGKQGGNIVAMGTPAGLMNNPVSVTGQFLAGKSITPFTKNRSLNEGIMIQKAWINNLRGFDISIPSGGIIAVSGVSGAGKSSLTDDIIYQSWKNKRPEGCEAISGFENFQRVISVQQKSPFTGSTGTLVTFTGIFDLIRDLFAGSDDAVMMNFRKNHFSFLNKEGRCELCKGMGRNRISMDFISDVWIVCEECKGKRYNQEVLACRYRAQSISDVLEMTGSEAAQFFRENRSLSGQLNMLEKVGIGYLQLGQSLDSLSGGESQRLILATELMKPGKGNCLYLFEEPSTGLHFTDILYLLELFHQLADRGNTLIIVEHDLTIIANADWIIDLGPEGGDKGGSVVVQGRLTDVINNENSLTGKFLKSKLNPN